MSVGTKGVWEMKDHKKFKELLEKSKESVWLIASHYTRLGHNVRILPTIVAPTKEQRWDYVDDGDIEIIFRIEIKNWNHIDFSSVDDIPYDDIIVDEAYKIEKEHSSKLFAYHIVNASQTGYLFIPASTKDKWFKGERFDRIENRLAEFYLIPKEYVSYRKIEE